MSAQSQLSQSLDGPILIVGAGMFGLSTAFELSSRGYSNITILDRAMPPVPDGSSVDVSRVIRYDYADPFYAKMAEEAMAEWKSKDWARYYHNTEFVLATEGEGDAYIEKCKDVLRSKRQPFTSFSSTDQLISRFPALQGGMQNSNGYINPNGGWANAQGAIRNLAYRCSDRGVSFVTGRRGTVTSLIIENSQVRGVNTVHGSLLCDRVILATGAWTNHLVDVTDTMSSSGQPVAFMQLTPEEAKSLEGMPVVINLTSGVFVFPPLPGSNLLKLARHSNGFGREVKLHSGKVISAPSTRSNNAVASFIPDEADIALRAGLSYFIPGLKDRPWCRRRLCWYADTQEGNFIVGDYPGVRGLFIAAGGAGHAFKFLPVIGRYVADVFENRASEEVRMKWKINPMTSATSDIVCNDGSRRGPRRRKLSDKELSNL